MKLILNEEETKEYLKDFKRAKEIYKKHNRLIELLEKCLKINESEIKFYNFLDREQKEELKKLFGRFYYDKYEE